MDFGSVVVNTANPRNDAASYLRGATIPVASHARFFAKPIWKVVKVGLCENPKAYRRALNAKKMIVSWSNNILDKITCSQKAINLELDLLSVGELGFKGAASYADICSRANDIGRELCPAEVGPALRYQYDNQPRGERVLIAMTPIIVRDADGYIFHVGHDACSLCLGANLGRPGTVWSPDYRFVFVHRRT
ncbi:MAG: hypothetical protein KBD21_04325 [Candidatus Pacebacteria bacterium]|nr:hypothetical protein [Candidatus Paceibacterota bacterium]